ncbi:MAG: hypothetical protein LAT64_11315 [Phycisphaerales bacterium]|nr:hypothetical protein [Planctomycetota bacterium]MCH8509340.1 hypothetical protein [Phycisphaerales bacterium]
MLKHALCLMLFMTSLSIGSMTTELDDLIYPPYSNDYQFGADGTADDPNGKDGWPADHPNNPTPGQAGKGGNGIGAGNGGKGGNGHNGSSGGEGGKSGPAGGCGGAGGRGGDNPNGPGGAGGKGGDGVDCGGAGGRGGDGSTSGGNGGCGGISTGGGQGGQGGNGGSVTGPGGFGGTGGCGGNSLGTGGCGGKSGNGGNYAPGSSPGLPSAPGYGTDANGNPCTKGMGEVGKPLLQAHNGPVSIKYIAGLEQLAFRGDDPLEEIVPFINIFWHAIPGSQLDTATWHIGSPFLPNGLIRHKLLLHPESLDAERVQIGIEFRVTGANPLLSIVFGIDDVMHPHPSVPVPLGDGWFRTAFTAIRPEPGVPMGNHLDMFVYETKDIEVRFFEAHDIGPKADVNMDGVVDVLDLQIVLANMFAAGDLAIEDGDTNLDGVVDMQDLLTVLEGLSD